MKKWVFRSSSFDVVKIFGDPEFGGGKSLGVRFLVIRELRSSEVGGFSGFGAIHFFGDSEFGSLGISSIRSLGPQRFSLGVSALGNSTSYN